MLCFAQTASRRRRIARGAGRKGVDVTNMIGSFSGMRAKMQQMSKMMKMGGGVQPLLLEYPGKLLVIMPWPGMYVTCLLWILCDTVLVSACAASLAADALRLTCCSEWKELLEVCREARKAISAGSLEYCRKGRHITHLLAGMPGMPQMSEQELMRETIQTAGSSVSRGKVRRKKDVRKSKSGRGGLAELATLR